MPSWMRFYLRLRKRLQHEEEELEQTEAEKRDAAFMATAQEFGVDIYAGAELAPSYAFEVHRAEVKDLVIDLNQVICVLDVEPAWNMAIVTSGDWDEVLPLHIAVDMRRQYLRNLGNAAD